MLKKLFYVNNGENSAEVNVDVIFLQVFPKVTSPYFTLVDRAQSINQTSDFGESVVQSCIEYAENIGNSNLLNHYTNGVSCEKAWNLSTKIFTSKGNTTIYYLLTQTTTLRTAGTRYLGGNVQLQLGYTTLINRL